jgi:hypothetical protein
MKCCYEAIAEKAGQIEAVKPEEKIAQTVKPARTVREAIEQKQAARRRPDHAIRPPGRSRSIGV